MLFPIFFFILCLLYPLLFYSWELALIVFGIRFIIQGIILFKVTDKLDEKDLFPWYLVLDVWMFFYYIRFSTAIFKKPKNSWK